MEKTSGLLKLPINITPMIMYNDDTAYNNGEKITIVSSFSDLISVKTINGTDLCAVDFQTMKQHFEHILTLLEEQVSNPKISVRVEYDNQLGYPAKVEYKGSGTDNWYTLEISNVKLLGRENDK